MVTPRELAGGDLGASALELPASDGPTARTASAPTGARDALPLDAPDAPVAQSAPPARTHRGRLFRRYLALILTLVTGALLISGGISIYFSYQESRAALAELQHEKAIAAASRIEQYIRQIDQQLAYAALPQLDAGDIELRRLEFLKLLRQAPEVTDIAQVDGAGREQIAVSRLGMDVSRSNKDRSDEPAFRNARRGKPWFGPVYFRKETEPYMTIAIRSGSDSGPVTIADVNLKFIWDVVSRIKIGDKGKAYVVDGKGFLIADPDIGLVLRKTNLANLPHVKASTERQNSGELAMFSTDLGGAQVLTSMAPIEMLGWNVFVEQPAAEVYAKLNASIARTGLLLLAGLVISAFVALALARGMVRPIRTLDEGARRIGAGELDQKIDVRTGDELEGLADQFNRMSAQLRESYSGLERKVEERTRELSNALEQQTAISEILRVISSSPTDVKPVLQSVAERAAHLCDAPFAFVVLIDGNELKPAAAYSKHDPHSGYDDPMEMSRESFKLQRTYVVGRAAIDRTTYHYPDILPLLDTEYPSARPVHERYGFRAILAVPLMRGQEAYGVILLWRREARAFSQDQIGLLETFARQAAIAIDNVRLFNETKDALDQQTAISEILRVISSSPTDVKPVLDAIAERAARLCDASVASMYLIDGQTLRLLASKGATPDPVQNVEALPINRDSLSGRAVLEQRAIQVSDLLVEGGEFPLSHDIAARLGHRTVIVMPLFREGKAFGTILLRRNEVDPFTDQEIALLRTFGDQAAIALENVRLFNETKEALDQQRASGEVLAAISSSIADTTPVFDRILASCERLFAGKLVQINLVGDDGLIHLGAHQGPARNQIEKIFPFPVDESSATGTAIVRRAVVHYPDVDGGSDVPTRAREGWQIMGIKAAIGAPMLWEGKGMGSILVGRDYAGPFSDKDVTLLRTFADQAVIAIQNARLFREIQDKSRQLEAANKHKSEFLAAMSHELRTPLNAIIGFSEVLLERLFGELNVKQDDYLKDIHASGKHLLQLINDILDLSKVEAGRMELDLATFDVPAAIANAMTLIRERAQRHDIAITLDADPQLGEIVGDERKFKQILLNLLSNAVKFTPDGGRIDVAARRSGGELTVSVHDTGIGIAAEDQQAVFEEFRQVGRSYTNKQEGTGLGLALTRKFVELHGGRIWLESEPGKGSTFSFTIPTMR
ncbi:MAG TPA: GAF domain-containing protein [Casimicrobiaceae bacterium]|nr:GAF domain-containing protein [Casimicrobiaceae bacterium]